MPPPPEENPLPLPLPRPKPKPPKPKPRPGPGPELKEKPRRPEPQRNQAPGGVPLPPDPSACATDCSESCAYYHLCPPPPPPPAAATVQLRSSRLPTPLIALSASLLAVSVVLLVALLVCRVARRRRQRRGLGAPQEAPLTQHHGGEEGGDLQAVAVEEGEHTDDGGGVHHVWYIRTVGLDERAIAAITALVYDGKKRGGGLGLAGARGGGRGEDSGDAGCAVCLAEFRDGETLRLLPRCGHAFHRGCIDTWLRAHVNCPLCRAPVQVADQAAAAAAAAIARSSSAAAIARSSSAAAVSRAEPAPNHPPPGGGAGTDAADREGAPPERAVRRAASMVALPRRPLPEASLRVPASSNSGHEGEMGLTKISRFLKLSEALEMAGIGARRSASFGAGAASCLRLPGRSGPSATGINTDEMSR